MASRIARLQKLFGEVISGHATPGDLTGQKASLFLESVYTHNKPVDCVSRIVASPNASDALQATIFRDLSATFFNGHCKQLIDFLRNHDLENLGRGEFLRKIVILIVNPPPLWNAFLLLFKDGSLSTDAQEAFAWLALQVLSLPDEQGLSYVDDIRGVVTKLTQSVPKVSLLGSKIQHTLDSRNNPTTSSHPVSGDDGPGPGGRHDNDFEDYRHISILPTAAEILSIEPPFLRPAAMMDEIQDNRVHAHLDNQFRLLREDMIYELKDELQRASASQGRRFRGMKISGLQLETIYFGPDKRRTKWALAFKCNNGALPCFTGLKKNDEKTRKKYLDDNKNVVKHGSLAVLQADGHVVGFPILHRDEDLLIKTPAILVLQFGGCVGLERMVNSLKTASNISLIQIDTAYFAYEPVLRALQEAQGLPFSNELLHFTSDIHPPTSSLSRIVSRIEMNPACDLKPLLNTPGSIILDKSQAESLLLGLTKTVSLIQGPPGTGKSFIGSLLAKALHDNTPERILIVCYTNHALDDVLLGLLGIGIPPESMIRLGSKPDSRTDHLSLFKQPRQNRTRADWTAIKSCENAVEEALKKLESDYKAYTAASVTDKDLLEYLEFENPDLHAAFQVPIAEDGMVQVGKKNRKVAPTYLFNRWRHGDNPGIFSNDPPIASSPVWKWPLWGRTQALEGWVGVLLEERVQAFAKSTQAYNKTIQDLTLTRGEETVRILQQKRIIGCTTTAAAKYTKDIQASAPGIVLVEEAGEILESHVLTALGKGTTRLILIGDHKQLRPKVNNYQLTVEKGDGFDLNVSLFERLILKDFPYATLSQQHRMRPEISDLIRQLTYPDLVDAPKTQNRPNLRGIQDNIVFIDHSFPEGEEGRVKDRMDGMSSGSKENKHEVEMILKIVRYLAQQGYGTEELVVLTPYLGQLSKLRSALRDQQLVDPILNDLDSFDLVKAGLITPAAAKLTQKKLRLSTIDNYQGEESDVVLISLTRSNSANDIGFMYSPERVNVLLSRARNGLIMIGNAKTFKGSRKGGELWGKLIGLLKDGKHVYDGLPIRCQQHPDRSSLLKVPEDFDEKCPDGGCAEPCGAALNCGLHKCPSKCHQIYDHSKMACEAISETFCSKGHKMIRKCHETKPATCKKCEHDQEKEAKRLKEEMERQAKRDAELITHAKKMAEIETEAAREREVIQDAIRAKEREDALQQKQKDLEALKLQAQRATATPPSAPPISPPSVTPPAGPSLFGKLLNLVSPITAPTAPQADTTPADTLQLPPSAAEQDWIRRKEVGGDQNDAIDAIMAMTGLESVKEKILEIKDKIETTLRQGTDLKKERFNIVFLGNPGTGKTTVARQYAKFLASMQVLPGTTFEETTGSRLGNDGIPAAKAMIEKALNAGGGAIFIDEAYQMTADYSVQGRQVLDFLLAEMENNVGKLIFILAGYTKNMEKFFEHNPGIPSRVPHQIVFNDYSDKELLHMFASLIRKKYTGRMKVEKGQTGLYARIAVRRLGRGRGKEGFGNARALENMVQNITSRQAKRIAKERKMGTRPDDFLLMKEDLIGPEPKQALLNNAAWERLKKLTGLGTVKKSVENLINIITTNYYRELKEEKPMDVTLNRVFLGSPGTGKTTVAKLYGQILADLGLLSNGEVVIKNPADFVGSVLGASESQTKAILAATVGKVLIIDEAYMLYPGGGPSGGKTNDPYKTAVIDTIVAEVQNVPGDDRCVLLLGYKNQMEEMFQNVNPGLARRFSVENGFYFEDFTEPELEEILRFKLKDQNLKATNDAIEVGIEVLKRLKRRPNFGNAGEVENLISQAKLRQQSRQAELPPQERAKVEFLPQDFDPDYNRGESAAENFNKLFEDIVGCEEVVQKLRSYQVIGAAAKRRGLNVDDQIPMNFVFKGPPGTGKTTIARKMGQIYYDMGFLSSPEVSEASASDLVGQYVGQTGPKARQLLEKSLGRVLFIDEAYRLSEGQFAKEAVDELVSMLTQPTFHRKVIVILAGYTDDMDRLMSVNSGLSSRFSEHVVFEHIAAKQCLDILRRELESRKIFCSGLKNDDSATYAMMETLFEALATLPSWGNARDVKTLAKNMINAALLNDLTTTAEVVTLEDSLAVKCMESMLSELKARQPSPTNTRFARGREMTATATQEAPPPPILTPKISTATRQKAPPLAPRAPTPQQETPNAASGRDPGVPDNVWQQLQRDKSEATMRENKIREELSKLQKKASSKEKQCRSLAEKAASLDRRIGSGEVDNELKKQREKARLEAQRLREQIAREREEMAKKKREEDDRRKKEAEAQTKLRRMGVCVAGFQWIKQASGYRCAGGTHFVSDDQLSRA